MLRWLSSKIAKPGSLRARLTFPDPERMPQIAQLLAQQKSDDGKLSQEFSAFVSSIRIGHVWKLTYPNRLSVTNRVLCQRLRDLAPRKIFLLDVGGSDGVTTQDLVELLRAELNVEVEARMIDLYIRLLRYTKAGVVEYRMADGAPIMVRVGPFGLQLSSLNSTRNPLSRVLGRFYLGRARFRKSMRLSASYSLVNPRVTADRGITVAEWSVLQRKPDLVNRVSVARASNVLNRGYFSPDQILAAAGHLHAYLVDGGLLAVSRNKAEAEEVETGSIWQKEGDRFRLLDDFGGGSEVAELINAFQAPATPFPV